tara:strand:- start:614 stop:925 length:312 start_codon:yes stop_codon:yes gene_type:complete
LIFAIVGGAAYIQGAPVAGAKTCGVSAVLGLDLDHGLLLLGGRGLPIARRDPTQSMIRLASCLFHEVNSASCRVTSGVQPSLETQKLPIKTDLATTVFWPKTK